MSDLTARPRLLQVYNGSIRLLPLYPDRLPILDEWFSGVLADSVVNITKSKNGLPWALPVLCERGVWPILNRRAQNSAGSPVWHRVCRLAASSQEPLVWHGSKLHVSELLKIDYPHNYLTTIEIKLIVKLLNWKTIWQLNIILSRLHFLLCFSFVPPEEASACNE